MLADTHSCQGLKSNALKYCKDNHNYIVKDTNWKTIEEEKPNLFQEAVTKVGNLCISKKYDRAVSARIMGTGLGLMKNVMPVRSFDCQKGISCFDTCSRVD